LREGQKIEINLSSQPESISYIKEKVSGKELSEKKIKKIIQDIVENNISEPEVAFFISGMYTQGMNFKETISLVDAILASGKTMKFRKQIVVDKHCIGGIAGNRTTPLVVSICAAAGLTFPKTSSRAITSAAGTADCIEVLSSVNFSVDQLKEIVNKTGACLSWGGAAGMVPADSKIIKVEKMLNLDPEAQLLASIMSKKLAAGSKYILIDIPFGKDAKVMKSKAKRLKKKFKKIGNYFGVQTKIVLTKATEPIGNGVGPALEIIDVMKILNQETEGPKDLEKKSLFLAGKIFEMVGKSKKGKGILKAKQILESGKAWKKFKEIIRAQGGKDFEVPFAKYKKIIYAEKNGKIKKILNKEINLLARAAGCPLDKKAGIYLFHHVGERITKGKKLMIIYAESKARLKEAIDYYQEEKPIKI